MGVGPIQTGTTASSGARSDCHSHLAVTKSHVGDSWTYQADYRQTFRGIVDR